MTSVDRIQGLSGQQAIKTPCRLATTANITLSGEQTIDGVAAVEGDRVLVKDQTTTTQNGVYDVSTGSWTRSLDFDGPNDIADGTMVLVNSGSTYADKVFKLNATEPITIGTTVLTFTVATTFTDISAFGATLLDDADAAAARTTLGLGTIAVDDATEYVAGALFTTAGDTIHATAANTPARLAATANVAAHATTMNLWAARENVLTGGAVTITDIADAPYAGAVTWAKMNAAHVWDDGAVFNVQGGADYTAAADDWVRIYATTVSTFEITVFKANGEAVVSRIVQVVEATPVASVITCNTIIPLDDTIPQNTEGNEVITVTITPTKATNRLRLEFDCFAGYTGVDHANVALFQDSVANAIAAASNFSSGNEARLSLVHEMLADTVAATTFKIRVGPAGGITVYVNGNTAGTRVFGGVAAARLRVTEITV